MGKTAASVEEQPELWEWLAQQHNNSDPVRADAARYVSERWQYGPWYNHRKVLGVLATEESPHLHGMRLLTDDYVDLFGLTATSQLRGPQRTGVVSPLVPVGREQCSHIHRSGKTCRRDAIPGTSLCGWHGGSWISESERAEVVSRISERLVDISDRAVSTLADLMDNAKSEKVRHDSAVAILDRIGLSPVQKVELDVTRSAEDAAAAVRARIEEIRARELAASTPTDGLVEDVVDGEIVEDG